MIRPSKPSPTQRPDMFRPCGCSTKYSVPLDRIEPSLAAYQPITISLSQSRSSLGAQTDPRVIRHGTALPGTGQVLDGQAVANYIAKDATKTITAPGLPSQRLRGEADLGHLRCSAHYRADHHRRLAARRHAACFALPGLGAHAWLRRALPD